MYGKRFPKILLEKSNAPSQIKFTDMNRRKFGIATAGIITATPSGLVAYSQEKQDQTDKKRQPVEAPFERDYDPPKFKPSWKKQQINRLMAQDFVIFAHSDLNMTKKLLDREPGLINATLDWGAGDWETALGGASHMGRKDIVKFLLSRGARIDIFCAAMMGQLDAVKAFLQLEPKLIDAKGPHGFTLHFHAQAGGKEAEAVLDHLQSIKKLELRPIPFLQKKKPKKN